MPHFADLKVISSGNWKYNVQLNLDVLYDFLIANDYEMVAFASDIWRMVFVWVSTTYYITY